MINQYSKRMYTFRQLKQDRVFLFSNSKRLKHLKSETRVSRAFGEKIMLAVTAVNDCVHCARFHTSLALLNGVERDEVRALLAQEINQDVDDYEAVALNFAQHYAESERHPDPEILREFYETYGKETADDIMLYIRLIFLGNLSGNTFDGFISRLRGKPAENSSLLFELYFVTVCCLFVVPIFSPVFLVSKIRALFAAAPFTRWSAIKL